MKHSIPSLPESSLVKYLGQIFHVNMGGCSSFFDAISRLGSCNICIPGLTGDDFPSPIFDRVSVSSMIYNVRDGSQLANLIYPFIPDDTGGAYLVVPDVSLSGKDSVFLLSVSIDRTVNEAAENNIAYMTNLWAKYGNPAARMITGACRLKDENILSIVAVQLSSLSPDKQ